MMATTQHKKENHMKEVISKLISFILIIVVLSACAGSQASDSNQTNETIITTVESEDTIIVGLEEALKKTNNNYLNENVQESTLISLEGNSASSDSNQVIIEENSIEIMSTGSYMLIGDYNGQIRVNTEEEGQVQLILAGVKLTNDSNAPIYIEQVDEAIITVMQGSENIIEDTSTYIEEEMEELDIERTNGAIYSKEDLVINGKGQLGITTNDKTAILSKDDLIIYDVTLKIDAGRNGLKGNDLVYISGATLDIQAEKKGIQSDILVDINSATILVDSIDDSLHSNDTVIIRSGNIVLTTEDDGIHADNLIQIDGGIITVENSYEGLEAKDIIINDGEVIINASDDGVNATDGTTETVGRGSMMEGGSYDFGIHIHGGILTINSYGDGLDSNGNIWMTGGTLIISGPISNGDGSIDYDGTFEMTGGVLVATGSSGMLQTPSQISTINSLLVVFDNTMNDGTNIRITNDREDILLDIVPEKSFTSVIYSSLDLVIGASYNIYINNERYSTIELTDIIKSYGATGGFGGVRDGGMQKGERPARTDGEMPQRPKGEMPEPSMDLPME